MIIRHIRILHGGGTVAAQVGTYAPARNLVQYIPELGGSVSSLLIMLYPNLPLVLWLTVVILGVSDLHLRMLRILGWRILVLIRIPIISGRATGRLPTLVGCAAGASWWSVGYPVGMAADNCRFDC